MTKKIKLIALLITISIVVFYLDYKIKSFDMRFYHGKDNGAFARIGSIVVLSSIFYLVMSKRNRFLQFFAGLFFGFLASILSYLMVGFVLHKIFKDFGLSFHILGCCIFIAVFFVFESIIDKVNRGHS